MKCSVDDCDRDTYVKEMCSSHYRKRRVPNPINLGESEKAKKQGTNATNYFHT